MLQKLLNHLQTHPGPVSREALSAELSLPPKTIDALLLLLLSKGRLEEILPLQGEAACTSCEDCPLTPQCGLNGVFQERYFRIPS